MYTYLFRVKGIIEVKSENDDARFVLNDVLKKVPEELEFTGEVTLINRDEEEINNDSIQV